MAPLGAILTAAGAANLAVRGFSYQTNGVRFLNGVADWGSFIVSDLSISAGQDPQSLNNVGDDHGMSLIAASGGNSNVNWGEAPPPAYPGFTFTVGRHKTDDVGNWWNSRIPANQNTFGQTAGALNFAFLGSMDLTISGCGTVSFSGIGLAQGSDSNGNNWWFGGQNCYYSGNNQAVCYGTKQDGSTATVTFQRGGKGQINDVYVNSCL